jgi:hypothetical protein
VRDVSEPRWVRVIALGSALAMTAFGAVGLLLADIGIYRPWLVLPIGLVVTWLLFRMARPLLEGDGEATTGEIGSANRICAILAVALSAIVAWWNASNASQHVEINRDGGLYLNTGKWIAAHGNFNLVPLTGPFANNPFLTGTSTGMRPSGDHVEFSLSHMLPALLAVARNVGGNSLMFATVPILGGVALLTFYLLANRLLRNPIAALAATGTLAFVMPQVSFSRDSTTEIPIQVLLFTGVWILCDRRSLRTPRLAFVAGLLLGLIQAMHIDGMAFIIGLPIVFATTWLHTKHAARRRVARGILWSSVGVLAGLLLGAFDAALWNHYYFNFVRSNLERLAAVEVLAIAAGIAIVLLIRHTQVFSAVKRARPAAGYAVGGLVLLLGFGAWFVRPHIEKFTASPNTMVEYVQRLNRMHIDGTRRYAELSVRWISWYVGPITLTLAIIGAAGLALAFVRGSLRLPAQVAMFMFAPPALMYLWRPSITPDQVWAARRLLPTVIPAVILLAFAVVCAIANDRSETPASFRRSLAIVLAITMVIFPLWSIRKVSQMTEQRGLLPVIATTCKVMGPKAAVVVLKELPKSVVYLSDAQTLRSFCNVPVAVFSTRAGPQALHALRDAWLKDGRRLFVVAEYPETIKKLLPNAEVVTTGRRTNRHLLESTLTRPPSRYTREYLQLARALVPAAENS